MTARYDQYAELLSKFIKPGYVPQVVRKNDKKQE